MSPLKKLVSRKTNSALAAKPKLPDPKEVAKRLERLCDTEIDGKSVRRSFRISNQLLLRCSERTRHEKGFAEKLIVSGVEIKISIMKQGKDYLVFPSRKMRQLSGKEIDKCLQKR